MNKTNYLYMGIDGGGTKCKVCIQDAEGNTLGTGLCGSANPAYGMDVVSESILNATKQALAEADLNESDMSRLIVGAGLGGLHLPRYQKLAESWPHPFKEIYFTNDVITATLGAHNGQDGGLIIVGTGFSASGVVNGIEHNIGGFGFALGETCSGYWIGHEAIQCVLRAYDNLGPQTLISQLLTKHLGGEGYELAEKVSHFSVKDFAALAPLVFKAQEQEDAIAQGIIEQSCQFTTLVANQLIEKGCCRVSLIGGIATQLASRLPKDIRKMLVEPIYQPEIGAILYAKSRSRL